MGIMEGEREREREYAFRGGLPNEGGMMIVK